MLTSTEIKVLRRLATYTDGEVVSYAAHKPHVAAFVRSLGDRGYVKIMSIARCGFEKVRGPYIGMTEAGRAALAATVET